MDPTARSTGIVAGLVIAGVLMGVFIGGLGGPDTEVTVQTVAVTNTQTVSATSTVTRTRTVTVPADTVEDEFDEDSDDETTETTDASDDCSLDYLGTCIPADTTDITCADIPDRDFDSVGGDPFDLDPDGDGLACES